MEVSVKQWDYFQVCHLCKALKRDIAIEIFLLFSPFSCCSADKRRGFSIEYLCLAVFVNAFFQRYWLDLSPMLKLKVRYCIVDLKICSGY